MTKSTLFMGYKKSELIKIGFLVPVSLAAVFLGPLWMRGAVYLALGIFGVVSVILVKRGIKKPEIFRPFRTQIGMFLMSIGFLGYGIDDVLTGFDLHLSSESSLSTIWERR